MRMLRVVLAIALAPLATAVLSVSATAEVFFKETQSRYDLETGLRTKRDLWRSVGKRGPRHGDGRAIGTALGKPRLNYRFTQKGDRCSISEIQMRMHVELRLPRFPSIHSADPVLKAYYRCIKKTVVVHEREHSRIWYETARKADRALKSALRDVPCGTFKQHASKVFRRTIAQGQKRQTAFDTADYARKRYQRCHAITEENLRDSIRFTTQMQPWVPPLGRNAPQWTRPAVERTPSVQTRAHEPKQSQVRKSRAPIVGYRPPGDAPSSGLFDASTLLGIAALLVGMIGTFAWLALRRPQGTIAAYSADDHKGSWADNIVLPDKSGHRPQNTTSDAVPPTSDTRAKPTFGKRRS